MQAWESWVEQLALLKALQGFAGLAPSGGQGKPRRGRPPPKRPGWVRRVARRVLMWFADGLIGLGARLKAACAPASSNGVEQNPKAARPGTAGK